MPTSVKNKPLVYAEVLEEIKKYKGPLGLITGCLLKGLHQSGASQGQIDAYLEPLKAQFPKLTNEDCRVLADVIYDLLTKEKQATKGKWY